MCVALFACIDWSLEFYHEHSSHLPPTWRLESHEIVIDSREGQNEEICKTTTIIIKNDQRGIQETGNDAKNQFASPRKEIEFTTRARKETLEYLRKKNPWILTDYADSIQRV